jgi:hypothetical protein
VYSEETGGTDSGIWTIIVVVGSSHAVPAMPMMWFDAIPFDNHNGGNAMPPDEVIVFLQDVVQGTKFQSFDMKYIREYGPLYSMNSSSNTTTSDQGKEPFYVRIYRGTSHIRDAGTWPVSLVLGMRDWTWMLSDPTKLPPDSALPDLVIHPAGSITVSMFAESLQRNLTTEQCQSSNLEAHWQFPTNKSSEESRLNPDSNYWFTKKGDRVFTPVSCNMKWFTPGKLAARYSRLHARNLTWPCSALDIDEGWQCLAERYPVIHYFGDSNGRRFLKTLISNGTWCHGRHEHKSCECEDARDGDRTITQPFGALGGPTHFSVANTPAVLPRFDPHRSTRSQAWWVFSGGILSGHPDAISDAKARLDRHDPSLPVADIVIVGNVPHDSSSMGGSLRIDLHEYAHKLETTLTTLKETYPTQSIVYRSANYWLGSPTGWRWYTHHRVRMFDL